MSSSRFDKLERPRQDDAEGEGEKSGSQGATLDRFGRPAPSPRAASQDAPAPLEPDPAPLELGRAAEPARPPDPVFPTTLERFEADGAQGLRMDRHSDEEQPFVRCPVCERDWGRFDTRCGQCGEPLDSDKAREFNRQLWAKRLAERKEEESGVAARALEHEKQARQLQEDKLKMGRAIAQQVKADYERDHASDRMTGGWGGTWSGRYGRAWPLSVIFGYYAVRSHGPARWVFAGLAVVALGIDVWLWFSRSD